ncbi:MAG: type II secretion system F family protein [Candidatus Sedimenticola sp. (ex Thyasira tokunagai)]
MYEILEFYRTLTDDPVRLLIMLLVAIAVAISVYTVSLLMGRREEMINARLRRLTTGKGDRLVHQEQQGAFSVTWIEPVSKLILPQEGWRKNRLIKKLVIAGFRGHKAIYIFLFSKIALAGLLTLGCLLVYPFLSDPFKATSPYLTLGFFVLIALSGFYLPDGYLNRRIKGRKITLRESFPDAMDMLMVCVEAGMALDAAINRVGEEIVFSHPQLGTEFRLVGLELRAGKERESALRSLADRTGLEEIESFVAVLIQAEQFGTSIAKTLRDFSNEMRTKRIQIAQERAAKLPVKLIFPVLVFIFPALFLVILAPAAVQIYKALITGGSF